MRVSNWVPLHSAEHADAARHGVRAHGCDVSPTGRYAASLQGSSAHTSTAVWLGQWCEVSLPGIANRRRTVTPPPQGAEQADASDQLLNWQSL